MNPESIGESTGSESLVCALSDPASYGRAEAEIWARLATERQRSRLLCGRILLHRAEGAAAKELIDLCVKGLPPFDRTKYRRPEVESFVISEIGVCLAPFEQKTEAEILREALVGLSFAYLPNRIWDRARRERRKEYLYRKHHVTNDVRWHLREGSRPGIDEQGMTFSGQVAVNVSGQVGIGDDNAGAGDPTEQFGSQIRCILEAGYVPGELKAPANLDEQIGLHAQEIKTACGEHGVTLLHWLTDDISQQPDESPRLHLARLTKYIAGLQGVQYRQARSIKNKFLKGLNRLPFAAQINESLRFFAVGPKCFRPTTIDNRTIEAAYVYNQRQARDFIEEYKRLDPGIPRRKL